MNNTMTRLSSTSNNFQMSSLGSVAPLEPVAPKPAFTDEDWADFQAWLVHLPIKDENLRAQMARSLDLLQQSYAGA
jgi:hypothetical protein